MKGMFDRHSQTALAPTIEDDSVMNVTRPEVFLSSRQKFAISVILAQVARADSLFTEDEGEVISSVLKDSLRLSDDELHDIIIATEALRLDQRVIDHSVMVIEEFMSPAEMLLFGQMLDRVSLVENDSNLSEELVSEKIRSYLGF